ncbi:sugar ABC transporter permease [Actinomadura spongiicola]|uniref:Sugar ABC transporter permease n=1 Tax=Actinomadura spongiicola TaxID=2303421 RepID=A0A372G9X9_9ACTN|nr:sugar ABC transporter permease [Actinomadura spongiicola]RFS81952.1 sugar ABC transporter permease [Actinomadura spongiicola]
MARPMKRALGETPAAWAFVLPATLLILGLSLLPMVWSLLLSFTDSDLVTSGRWVGMDNYERLLDDPAFRQSIRNTLIFTALYVPGSAGLGLLIAMALNRPRTKLIGIYRTCVIVPFVVSPAATGVLFAFICDARFGVANRILSAFGIPRQGFLEDPNTALYTLTGIGLWGGTGFCVIIFLAALQDIPPSLVEAARIDGAGRWNIFRHVTLPSVRPVTTFVVIWQSLVAMQLFDLVYATTRGGPLGSTAVVVYFIYNQAFKVFDAGYGAAAAYVLAVVLLALGGVRYLLTRARRRFA